MRSTERKTVVCTTRAFACEDETPRPIIVEITGDALIFRHKGKRRVYTLNIETAFREAILRSAL